MDRNKKSRRVSFSFCLILFLSLSFYQSALAKIGRSTYVKLTLENKPDIGGIAIFKLVVSDPVGSVDADIGCFLPEGLEFINDQNYRVVHKQAISGEWGYRATFYSGSIDKEEKKEFIFKVRIPDSRKYLITGGGGDNFDTLEIDLGDPEPPEWNPEVKKRAGIIEGIDYIISGIKQARTAEAVATAEPVDLKIPKDTLPPLRTEFKIRTKERPELGEYKTNPKGPIPFRYLVYVENEFPKVEVNCILPPGWSMDNQKEYSLSQDPEGNTTVLLYSGPMRFKECKAFYFKILPKVLEDGRCLVKAEATLILSPDERLTKTDTEYLYFGRVLE